MGSSTTAGAAIGVVVGGLVGFAFGRPMHPAVGALIGAAVAGTAGGLIGSSMESPAPPSASVTLAPGGIATVVKTGGMLSVGLPPGAKWQSLKDALGTEFVTSDNLGTNTAVILQAQGMIYTGLWTDSTGTSQTTALSVTTLG